MRFGKRTVGSLLLLSLLSTWQCQAFSIQHGGTAGTSSWSRQTATTASKTDLSATSSESAAPDGYPLVPGITIPGTASPGTRSSVTALPGTASSTDRLVKSTENTSMSADIVLSESEFPINFELRDEWYYLQPKQKACETHLIPTQVAYQCINKRGAIAHGRPTELQFDVNVKRKPMQSADDIAAEPNSNIDDYYVEEQPQIAKSVEEVFDELGGYKELESISEIKREIVTRGPVVSTSFTLTETFMMSLENRNRFDPNFTNKRHPVAIVGWEHTDFGEVWLIQPLIRGGLADLQKIAFRQYGIDEKVIAPINSFENIPWQSGPYFDIDLSDTPFPEWSTEWPGLETSITTIELEKLGEVIADDLISPPSNRSKFIMRDKNKIARSRECYLTKMQWQNGDKAWRVEVAYLDN